MSRHRRFRATFALLLAHLSVACDSTGPRATVRTLQIVSGDDQTTRRGDDVAEPLRVRAVDSDGHPVQGMVIQWVMSQGQATLEPWQTTTNSRGEADTRVKNVATIGPMTVRASVQGTVIATFALTSLDPCLLEAMPPYELGSVLRGVLSPLDCVFDNRTFWDFYLLRLASQQALAIRVRSDSAVVPEVGVWDRNGRHRGAAVTAAREAVMKVILAPGPYGIGVGSLSVEGTGPYELVASPTSASTDVCETIYVVRGIATTQELTSSDCADASGPSYDRFFLVLYPDDRVIVTASSTQFVPRLQLVQVPTLTVVADVEGSSGTATIDFTSPTLQGYRIYASSALPQQSGSYTLAVSHPPGVSANVSAPAARLGAVHIAQP